MSLQLPLPARWAIELESRRDPLDRLAALRRDVLDAKAEIRVVLDQLADRHRIPAKDIRDAVEGYADDMLSDAIFHIERDLEREIDGEPA